MQNEVVERTPLLACLSFLVNCAGAQRHAWLRDVVTAREILEGCLEILTLAAR
jgi:hypothetical protein